MGSKRKRASQDVESAPTSKKLQKSSSSPNSTVSKKPTAPLSIDALSPFLDNPRGPDLKREVDLYNLLGNEDGEERAQAASAVISGLLGGDGVDESTLQRHLERRLFRGLASGRNASRLGFSLVLSVILEQLFGTANLSATKYTGLTFDNVLSILVAKTKPDGDLSGQEEKDHALGLLFGLQCFVRAKILFTDEPKWPIILDKLLELSKKKPWVRETCGQIIVEAVLQMDKRQAELTLENLHDAGLSITPEGVAIWITAKNQFPKMKFPVKPWGNDGNPLDRLQNLAKALKESSSNDGSQQAAQTGSWNAKLHFVWGMVLARYASAAQSDEANVESEFGNFWKVTVDESLFSATASRERKFWGFLLFQKVLEDATAYQQLLPYIFSHNLVRCLINSVQNKDRFLNRAADKSLKVLHSAADAHTELIPRILPQLIGNNGNYSFDKITKTKTIEKLLQRVDKNNAKEIIDVLLQPILQVEGTDVAKDAESQRQMFGDYLLSIIRRVDVSESVPSWIRKTALPKLFDLSYGNSLTCQPPLSERTRTLFRNRLTSAFTHLLTDLERFQIPCDLLSLDPDAVKMDEQITEAKDQAISTMSKILKKAKKAEEQEKAPIQALALLYALVILQLYNGEPEAISIFDELKLCYDKLIRHKDSDSDIEVSEVLVELLLSFLSKPSALLRKVTQHVFSAFMGEITAGGLKLMTDILESGESLKGQQELFDQEPEDLDQEALDDGDNSSQEDDLDSDVEVTDLKVLNGHLDQSEGEEQDEDEDEDEEDAEEGDDEEAKKLDDALAKALGTRPLTDGAEEEDSDADMTDSEMMELDSKLVEIFKQRKNQPNKKQEQKDAKETMVNFKSRVLDLLEIYVKKQAANPLAFDVLIPLLQLIRSTKTNQLGEKAHNIIMSFAKAAKSAKGAEIDLEERLELLKAIHREAPKGPSHMYSKAASNASLLVASSLYRADKDTFKQVAVVYTDSLVASQEGAKIQTAFFHDWINWSQNHG